MEDHTEPPSTFGSSQSHHHISSSDSSATAASAIDTSLSERLDVVPDSLIALAKDARYVKEVQDLVLQVLSSVLPRRRHALLEQESWMLASLLCLALGLRHTLKGTTLGMETVGLQFPQQNHNYSRITTAVVGGGGRWKLVSSVLMTLSWAYAFSPHRSSSTMINSTTTNSSHSDNRIGGTQEQQSASDETLRGESRREFHERQRQAMLLRARQASNLGRESSRPTNSNDTTTMCNGSTSNAEATPQVSSLSVDEIKKKVIYVLLKLSKVLAAAMLSPFEGPHTSLTDAQQQQQQQQQNGTNNSSIQQAGRWLAKLQLSHFCLTGRYPTWMHRFSGHPLIPEIMSSGTTGMSSTTTRLHHRPTTVRLVGLLLGAQVVATFVKASSSAASNWLVQREHRHQQQALSSSPPQQLTPAVVFESHTGASQTSDDDINNDELQRNASTKSNRSGSICSICKMERNHPAAPEACGHVFCWRCLVQWVSTIRPECPLCRASCRPQDIVALYNYQPGR